MNARIGLPMVYWQHGGSALFGYLTVLVLVAIAVAVMLATRKRETGGPLFSIVALLVGAGVVLQFLPRTETGFLFVPVSPWSFVSGVPFLLSLLSWASIGIAVLVMVGRAVDAPMVISNLVLFSMTLTGLLSFAHAHSTNSGLVVQVEPVVATAETPMDRHQDQIVQWRAKRDGIGAILNRLTSDREQIAARVSGTKEPVRSELADELRHLEQQIEQVRRDADLVNSAIVRGESRLRRLDRQRVLGNGVVTDREYEEISESLGALGEELR